MKTKDTATKEEKANFLEALASTKSGIEDAIILLSTIKAVTGDPNETNKLNVKLLDIEAENAKIQATLLAYGAGTARFNPPSDELVDSIKTDVAALDTMVAAASNAAAAIVLATELMEKWNQISA